MHALLAALRALRFDERGSPILAVRSEVETMETYVHLLTAEFEQHYKNISRSQSVYEARMKRALESLPSSDSGAAQLPANSPWNELSQLSQLTDFLRHLDASQDETASGASEYRRSFLLPLDRASDTLRRALDSELA